MNDENEKFEKFLFKAIEEFTKNMRSPLREIKSKEPFVRFVSMASALNAVQSLMESIPQFKDANFHIPFRELHRSLYLLKEGVELPEFATMRSPKSETSHTKFFKAKCALAMDLLMGAGHKRLDAARVVSQYIPKSKLKPETIANWRDNLIGNSSDPWSKDFKLKTDGLKKMNLSKEDIKHFFMATKGDLRGVNLKRQINRVMKRKK